MWIWFYEPETQEMGFLVEEPDSSLSRALRPFASPPRPVVWFGLMLRALRELGYAVPDLPYDPSACALVYWDEHGNMSFYPLQVAGTGESYFAQLGHVLHQLAQLLIEHPDLWEEASTDGEEKGGFCGVV